MLDDVDKRILELLSNDGRMSVKDLAQHVGLSAPSTSERIKRLEERGVIRGFTVEIDPASIGFTLQAIIRVRPLPGKLHVVQQLIEAIPEISECDKVTGDDCFIARLHVRSIEELDTILDRIADKAETNTSIVKLQPVKRRLLPLS
ncbi:Lrp/AsnC family transcriptional regulator [Agrobacterium tumefaciens]|uniref:AsnC family transcriptional regulator n=1 Tax=Rhizobium rhizogenes TaxID=359 RepID=A0AA92C3W0_RHIRH|nr:MULTISPECIES: Lrp/AsnC family transcriptional regulator [Rhizobium/Agrobacterium group]MDP9571283.1 Lrp/AsnC family leucine-responsive transcriptional regulator [Agrobacterium larrymoorei]MQB19928.1 Lrp/AsnC family transcriptional regulator [Agrobacterium tumefaciens]PVE77212.1 AsnC family transcriptional regulator [Sphingomonas sp. TPD3009]MDD1498211.1 Lrp/AsnC family transcriptional regulator [Agrobacterium sp. CNPSo 3708]PVE54880.1 AsnC family transcriptional regulator [Rhizobium rhizoge